MKILVTALAVSLSILAIPGAPEAPEAPDTVDVSYSFRITHVAASGHGCAVNGLTITNRHMVDPRDANDFSQPHKIRFRYDFGPRTLVEGRGYSDLISSVADLAVVKLDKDPPFGYAALGPKPSVGEPIYWVEYDWRKRDNLWQPRGRKATVINVFLGQVLLDDAPSQGASGGCAYDSNGGVVGLITWYQRAEDGKMAGGVTGLWGDWFKDVAP